MNIPVPRQCVDSNNNSTSIVGRLLFSSYAIALAYYLPFAVGLIVNPLLNISLIIPLAAWMLLRRRNSYVALLARETFLFQSTITTLFITVGCVAFHAIIIVGIDFNMNTFAAGYYIISAPFIIMICWQAFATLRATQNKKDVSCFLSIARMPWARISTVPHLSWLRNRQYSDITGVALLLSLSALSLMTIETRTNLAISRAYTNSSDVEEDGGEERNLVNPTENVAVTSTPTGISFMEIYLNDSPATIIHKLKQLEFYQGDIPTWEQRGMELFGESNSRPSDDMYPVVYEDITVNIFNDLLGNHLTDPSLYSFFSDTRVRMLHYKYSSPFQDVRFYYSLDGKISLALIVVVENDIKSFHNKLTEKYGNFSREQGRGFGLRHIWELEDQKIYCGDSKIAFYNMIPINKLIENAKELKLKKEAEPTPIEKALGKL